jgi:AraC family transcriptional regulator of adaptative response / DNA-3-methyladenine glycosylase II
MDGMKLEPDVCYRAVMSRDARFDGVFFVGVSTTKIYCRPICTVRTPGRDRCTFYPTAAAAEQFGYRPCLRCRPELAPGNARVDAISQQAAIIANRIEDGFLTEKSVADLAQELGISDRHLRRIVEKEFGVSPIELAQTQRLLLAKRLLTDTHLSMTAIAAASGFSSLRRFNALFQERYRMNPMRLRKAGRTRQPEEVLRCEIAYRPPLDWEALLEFLERRAFQTVEHIEKSAYVRTVAIKGNVGWLKVAPSAKKNVLEVTLSASLAGALSSILARVKRLFDLSADAKCITSHLGSLALAHPGLRVPGAFDSFEVAVRAVLGQQVSVSAATTISGRFAKKFGQQVETPFESLSYLFPSADCIASKSEAEIASIGLPAARARTIKFIAQAVASRSIVLEPGVNAEQTMNKLKTVPGIGEWTAQYIAMRSLSWPDAFPHTDLGIYKALKETNGKRLLEIAEAWRPWRSYATMHLWKSLEAQK